MLEYFIMSVVGLFQNPKPKFTYKQSYKSWAILKNQKIE